MGELKEAEVIAMMSVSGEVSTGLKVLCPV